ncbi:hypothetical protein EVG20_g3445 [Dentipellis fragilis]|uniref:Uncharacterized protein n=1 Tax=Dentipellis fragilis TaxID=205917 RepID=A0A4Y9Z3T6_9AGAM|nr:hypothetical protein EVG20_g3445 [Dentipellis fragilis]
MPIQVPPLQGPRHVPSLPLVVQDAAKETTQILSTVFLSVIDLKKHCPAHRRDGDCAREAKYSLCLHLPPASLRTPWNFVQGTGPGQHNTNHVESRLHTLAGAVVDDLTVPVYASLACCPADMPEPILFLNTFHNRPSPRPSGDKNKYVRLLAFDENGHCDVQLPSHCTPAFFADGYSNAPDLDAATARGSELISPSYKQPDRYAEQAPRTRVLFCCKAITVHRVLSLQRPCAPPCPATGRRLAPIPMS